MARIVVSGYMVRHPVAGNMLAYFHYVLGLERLGHEVAYVEESGWPYSCYDPLTRHWHDFPVTGLGVIRALFAEHKVLAPVIYVNSDSGDVDGCDWTEVKRIIGAADLLLNIGGVSWLPEFQSCPRRALIDQDPLFTQVEGFSSKVLHQYHRHFTYGANLGTPACTVPTAGIDWIPTAPPVVLDLWPWAHPPDNAPFTTIGNWSAYGGVTYKGEEHGQKDREFLRLLDLPRRSSQRLELALAGASDEVMERFRASGWSVRDAGVEVSVDVPTYRAYISASRGELSAVKHAYVKTRSGWFSDRSVCYLAVGLPVILQDTGFGDWLPTGHGLFAFSSVEEAAERLEQVDRDYAAHRQAARTMAERVFSHRVVLPRLLDQTLGSRTRASGPAPSGMPQ